MDQDKQHFIDAMGDIFERSGSTAMTGRVLAALMISDTNEMSAEDFATVLGASRGSISTSTRTLIAMGLLRKVHKSGDRKDWFRVLPNAWANVARRREAEVSHLREIFLDGLHAMEADSDDAKSSIQETLLFLEFWQEEMGTMIHRWRARLESDRGIRD